MVNEICKITAEGKTLIFHGGDLVFHEKSSSIFIVDNDRVDREVGAFVPYLDEVITPIGVVAQRSRSLPFYFNECRHASLQQAIMYARGVKSPDLPYYFFSDPFGETHYEDFVLHTKYGSYYCKSSSVDVDEQEVFARENNNSDFGTSMELAMFSALKARIPTICFRPCVEKEVVRFKELYGE